MTLLRIIEQTIRLVALGLLDLKRAGVRRVLAAILLLEVLVMWMCAHPTHPLWSGWMVPVLRTAFGDYYLHYPQSFIGLPSTGSAARLVIELFVGPFVAAWLGWAVLRLADTRRRHEQSLARASGSAYPSVLALTVLVALSWFVLYAIPQIVILPRLHLSYRPHVVFSLVASLLPVVVMAPLFFALPHLLREGRGLMAAIRASWRIFRDDPLLPLLLSTLPWATALPFVFLLQRSALLAASLRPEVVLVIMATAAAVALMVEFITIDASVRLFLRQGGRDG